MFDIDAVSAGGDTFVDQANSARDVIVVEVGPRDGLQNEAVEVPTRAKIAFIDALTGASLPVIEATSFVNPKAVPQMADAPEVMRGIRRSPATRYPALVPNAKGLERALTAGVDAIALFTAATESFAQANVGASIAGTLERFATVTRIAVNKDIWVRGYISVAFGCPYAGAVHAQDVVPVAEQLLALGCAEICLADTIGVAEPVSVTQLVRAVAPSVSIDRLALHFHDTSGYAIRNVAQGLDAGVRVFDASAGGLGGCPFAPGAPGNLDTVRLVTFLEDAGLCTGVDREGVANAVRTLSPHVSGLREAP